VCVEYFALWAESITAAHCISGKAVKVKCKRSSVSVTARWMPVSTLIKMDILLLVLTFRLKLNQMKLNDFIKSITLKSGDHFSFVQFVTHTEAVGWG